MNKKIYVDKGIEGFGVFAKKPIRSGETILVFGGKEIVNPRTDNYILQTGKNKYMRVNGRERFVNHSCNPNSGLKNSTTLVAIRDISKGDEITFDYSTCVGDEWKMKCLCKSKNCRKIIKAFRYLPKSLKKKYIKMKIVPRWVDLYFYCPK